MIDIFLLWKRIKISRKYMYDKFILAQHIIDNLYTY